MDLRTDSRLKKRFPVRFGNPDKLLRGFTQDFSGKGVGITAPHLFAANQTIAIVLETPEGMISMRGEIRWAKRFPHCSSYSNGIMGIVLRQFPEQYRRFFEGLNKPV